MLFFVELINAGSLIEAGEALGISKSTGSRWLCDLEAEFGVTLYQRNNRHQRLTEAGSFLYGKLSEFKSDITLLATELSQYSTKVMGKVRICCAPTPYYSDAVILPLVDAFMKLNPLVDVQLLITPNCMELSQEYDFVLTTTTTPSFKFNKQLEDGLIQTNLLIKNNVTVASPKYIKKYGEPLVPSALVEHKCLCSSVHSSAEWVYRDAGKLLPAKFGKIIELSDMHMLLLASINSMGIGYLPEFILQPHLKNGDLVPVLQEYETTDWCLDLLHKEPQFMTPCVKEFKNFFLERHEEMVNSLGEVKNAILFSEIC
jgi:DNA-binding transcriptional LysR family regulator